jgi:anaerobic magnesium-protoporphyrin IX monomethyl ester cyclase
MRALLINPPYQTLTSNVGVGHQVPLGLLMVGGSLLDGGHEVTLLDAEARRLSLAEIVAAVEDRRPDLVMSGHAGSTPAHPVTLRMFRAIRARLPEVRTVYGGVYPTYQAERILREEPAVDFIVRGEGEAVTRQLLDTLAAERPLAAVPGLVYRADPGAIRRTAAAPPIPDLDAWRTGWELIEDWDRYHCFGVGRAAILQFSRGCPHRCTYCGQHAFWETWRYRDPVRVADEVEWLHRTHDIRFITLADENPTTLRKPWQRLLEELTRRRLPVSFFATIRASDIVRDADILSLYRSAGIQHILMGIETTRAEVIERIRKRSDVATDLQACRLLKAHGIFSIIGHIVGFEDETWKDFRAARRHLAEYGGDFLNAMYVTPHPWTAFGREVADKSVVEPDLAKWDYRHQVLRQSGLRPWQLFLAVKWLEVTFHLRWRRLRSLFAGTDPGRRRQLQWGTRRAAFVWLGEVLEFLARGWRRTSAATVRQVYGPSPEIVEPALSAKVAKV